MRSKEEIKAKLSEVIARGSQAQKELSRGEWESHLGGKFLAEETVKICRSEAYILNWVLNES